MQHNNGVEAQQIKIFKLKNSQLAETNQYNIKVLTKPNK
jgi:hypothetical protein